MVRQFLLSLCLVCFAAPLAADPAVPERRAIITRDVDFYGSDLTALFDTTYPACQAACLANPECRAFTFNTKSKACFPKSAIRAESPFNGAYSARIADTSPRVLAQSAARADDLEFLGDYTLQQVRKQAEDIGRTHPGGGYTAQAMIQAAQDRIAEGDIVNAMRWTGAAASSSDASDQWTEYARLSLLIAQDKSRHAQRAVTAAANGYLRGLSDGARVNALLILADALERTGRGREMVQALRLANDIDPRADVVAALDVAAAKYGFRISENTTDNESATPRICAEFTEDLIEAGTDYAPYVRLADPGLVVRPEGRQICIDGVQHGERYRITFRRGLPAATSETLLKDVEITAYVRDRAPQVRFPGRAYVLPRAADTALPVETVNLDQIELALRRVSDRNLLRAIQDDYFGRPLNGYDLNNFSDNIAQDIWTGTGEVQNQLNQTMTTRLPLGDVLADQPPGIYTLTAKVEGGDSNEDSGATQWFVLTDLGLTTLMGNDGLHVFARSLASAGALEGIEVTLLSRANAVLGTATSDTDGHVQFDAGLTRGTGGAAPALVIAKNGDEDAAFLTLTDPAFDLSDRGVEGRPPAPPVDVFLATDRGAYRAGEVIHATALARDDHADAITGLPLTAILTRPDGVEYARHLSAKDAAGGHVFNLPVGETAPRGTWTLDIKADLDAPALASTQLLVEDFLPERIDFTLSLPEGTLSADALPPLKVEAKYLFGAPGAGLKSEGQLVLRPTRSLGEFPGYLFGRYDSETGPQVQVFDTGLTDTDGRLTQPLDLPEGIDTDQPHEATVVLRLREGSGRPVERQITRTLAPTKPIIGIKPAFDGVVPQGSEARFDVIGVAPDLTRTDMPVKWTLNRVTTRYQWYQQYGNWEWEPITTRARIATGEGVLGAAPLTVIAPVEWGQYELLVERSDGPYVASSVDFYAGWYAPADSSQTPDTLDLSLDSQTYTQGDTAQLRIVPRYAGTALITVMSNRVISRRAVDVREGENVIPIDVTGDWGAGAYVSAQVIRPMDVAAGQNPARSLGLAYATIDPGKQQLNVTIDAPDTSDPRGPLTAKVKVDGLEGETGFVTLAAVDLGILNLTGFDSPDPSAHYFGQRRLGVEIRDIYGRLIDGMNGAEGRVRSGGDAGNSMSRQSPPPTEELVAYFTGPLTVGADGTAEASFDITDFNGTVRLMAIAWSAQGVGQADRDVLVRDPVVLTASVPRFLAPGDRSSMLLEIVHATGPTGRVGLDITAPGLTLAGSVPTGFDLGEGQKQSFRLPVTAGEAGDYDIRIALTTPDGKGLTKSLTLPVRANDPPVSQTRQFQLAAGGTFTLSDDIFAGYRPGTGEAVISAGALARLNVPGLLQSLDRYPYGCTEQVTSRALPLLYFNQVASALGLGNDGAIRARIDQAVARVLTRQTSSGAFGMWRAQSGDFWLDAYVADFLSRARAEGFDVPDRAFTMAMDNLRNRVNYAPDFDNGGQDIAYALVVLAREGAAAMGDLRYYADVKSGDFATPLAQAQLGAALAFYGDQTRADRMFNVALARSADDTDGPHVWRADYGTALRDRAGVLALLVEAGSDVGDRDALARGLNTDGPHLSTQEEAWSLLAARALIDDTSAQGLTLNGDPVTGPFIRTLEADTIQPQTITNTAQRDTDITLTTFGVPLVPGPADGYGYRIARQYYDMDGARVSLEGVPSGTRLVAVLTVTPFEESQARLIIDDPLPAGLEIDNPNLVSSGDVRALDWLETAYAEHSEFRSDRFIAAVDWRQDNAFNLAYIVRAISPGQYHHPAATVEDMYRPEYRAHTDTGAMTVTE
ncbi:alpha-2-macroglobulin family protein [Roseovarius sp. M141]|uniref:alpha-2-macroglobulin family protein n=1 Tax=Roseovarius sp. M141 TaxID=2583806 RepID=UPI0020CC8291|nr:alpha-2-macroglobulin family protein [Roseovarius sp. M141]MCQ0091011.1 alpha-2-macroglobulin family protein [Roseovarius sp. M141]